VSEGYLYRSGMRMRFHPKRRASTDQAPGPSSARAAPRVPSMIQLHGSPSREKACHHAMTATSAPATGVQKPASKRIPTHVVTADSIADPNRGPLSSFVVPCTINAIPAASRINRRPMPGEPRANVENSRRTTKARLEVPDGPGKPRKGRVSHSFGGN
jgi:hypothetical protein